MFSLPVGSVISTNGSYLYTTLCESGFANFGNSSMSQLIIFCQNLPISNQNVLVGYPTPIQCNTTVYDDPMNPTVGRDGPSLSAVCGYNQDNGFYCPMMPGDKPFKDLVIPILNVFKSSNKICNPSSLGFAEGGCL